MTTLPQVTPLRLPRPASTQLSIPSALLPATMAPAAPAPTMTGGDVWRVLRANLWLIIVMLVLSAAAGYVLNQYLLKHSASYTTYATVSVQAPTIYDPVTGVVPVKDASMWSMQVKTEAFYMSDPSGFSQLLQDPSPEVREWIKEFPSDQEAKADLKKNFVVTPYADTHAIQISFTSPDKRLCPLILESLVNKYITASAAKSTNKTNTDVKNLENDIEAQKGINTGLRDDIRTFQEALGQEGIFGPGKLNIKENEMQRLTTEAANLSTGMKAAQEDYSNAVQMNNSDQDTPKVSQMVSSDPEVSNYRNIVNNISISIDSARPSTGELNQAIIQKTQQLAVYSKKLDDVTSAARVKYRNQAIDDAKLRISELTALSKANADSLQKIHDDIGKFAEMQGKLSQKLHDLELNEIKLKTLNDQKDQIKRVSAVDSASVEWHSHPEQSDIPSFPKLPLIMGASIVVGLALALGIAFLRELLDTTIRSPRDISRVGNMNLLGMVPHEDDDPQSAGARLPVVIFEAPHSMMAEQLRQVRTRMQHSSSLDTMRSILVTSPSPGDGKSTIACNLASGLALNGRRILLVDANFRRPELHRVFNLTNEQGFSDVLNSIDLFEHAVQETQVPNLYILPSGPKPTNATELLESQLLIDFIERALEEFDHVIFDSGPLLFVSETVALAPRVDGVVTVVRARTNSRGVLSRMRDTLKQVKAEHLGVVLNAVRAQGGGYYGRNIRTYYEYQNGGPA